jgi:hypothetical protein
MVEEFTREIELRQCFGKGERENSKTNSMNTSLAFILEKEFKDQHIRYKLCKLMELVYYETYYSRVFKSDLIANEESIETEFRKMQDLLDRDAYTNALTDEDLERECLEKLKAVTNDQYSVLSLQLKDDELETMAQKCKKEVTDKCTKDGVDAAR